MESSIQDENVPGAMNTVIQLDLEIIGLTKTQSVQVTTGSGNGVAYMCTSNLKSIILAKVTPRSFNSLTTSVFGI